MGNSLNPDPNPNPNTNTNINPNTNLLHSLQLYEERHSQQLGHVKIFRHNEKPFRYYMLYRETGINEEKTRARLQQKLAWYCQLKEHQNIVNIESVDLQPTLDMCIQKISLNIYAKYYNYTLEMAVLSKLKRNLRFREVDLLYILVCLLSIGRAVSEVIGRQYCGWFSLNNIYLSPEGFVKVYPFPLYCELKPPTGITRLLQSPHKHTKSLLDNEEIVLNISRKTSESSQSNHSPTGMKAKQNGDIKDIGVLILQLLILNRQTPEVHLYHPEKISSILSLQEKEGQIGPIFKDLLSRLLNHPNQPRYADLLAYIEDLKETKSLVYSNSLKLEEGASRIEWGIYEKNETLKLLSEHKNLKAGCISIVSSKKRQL